MRGIRQRFQHFITRQYHLWKLKNNLKYPLDLSELRARRLSRDEQYAYCLYFFQRHLPAVLREHRQYFASGQRGFGEEAFHAMWFLLFQAFHPRSALEIGVFRGQTITLWKLLAGHLGFDCEIGCVSPFAPVGDSVSRYEEGVDYYEDVLLNHRRFNLALPLACRELSTSPAAKAFIQSRKWDVVYIDGCHDYEVAREDWNTCSQSVPELGIIVLDDSSLETDYHPPCFSTAGHPGPSRVAQEINPTQFTEVFAVGHNRVFQRIG
jgi:hypothetical protein